MSTKDENSPEHGGKLGALAKLRKGVTKIRQEQGRESNFAERH